MRKKLKIAQIAPLWFSIPPRKYGGTERIISYLTEGLTLKGHQVTLFASGDSRTKAKLVSVIEKGLIEKGIPWHDWWWNNFNFSVAFEKANNFDLLHCHWNILGANFQRFVKTPVLHTFHNIPSKKDCRWKIFEYYKEDLNAVFISHAEKRNCPLDIKKSWVIYNGIPVEEFKFNPHPKNHFIWIARVSKAKGIENAILAAEKTNSELLLAGQIQPMLEDYFKKEIQPRLTDKIKYIGEISHSQLSNFYGQARACLYPIEWEEPFGLVMVEAMACGTPVIAFDRGSVREIIKDGKTGFVVKDVNEMIKAMKMVDRIDRRECRKWVENNFTVEKMVDAYEKLFYQIIESHQREN